MSGKCVDGFKILMVINLINGFIILMVINVYCIHFKDMDMI